MQIIPMARKFKCTYSRYADDLTISTNQKDFPKEIAYQIQHGNSAWALGDELLYAIDRAGFCVNHKKTRMQYRDSRQVVTGLTVNKCVNIQSDYYKAARAMCNSAFSMGNFTRYEAKPSVGKPGTIMQLEGIVNHIYFVKKSELARTAVRPGTLVKPTKDKIKSYSERKGIELLYCRFLAFKKFATLEQPLIIAEGKTDYTYLRSAIKGLTAYHSVFRTVVNGAIQNNFRFLRHSKLTRELLSLDGSSSYLPRFISDYEKMVTSFRYAPRSHPVIILIDNDDGAKKIFSALKEMNVTVDHKTSAPFYRIVRNLYLVKTPEIGPTGFSQIEDLFDAATLGTMLNGKKFNKHNDTDSSTEYGKAIFAEKVVLANSAKISFSGFDPLLQRLAAVIAYHKTVVASGSA